jgi:hypothetical protein
MSLGSEDNGFDKIMYFTYANVLRQCENVQVDIANELDIKVVSLDVTIDCILTNVSTFGSSA